MTREIISRKDARAQGLKRYFTNQVCPHGHNAERYVSIGRCVECSQAGKIEWAKANPEKASEHGRSHYQRNPSAYKLRAKKWKRANPDRALESSRRAKKDPARKRELEAARRKQDPERFRVAVRNRRAKKRSGGKHSATDIQEILRMQRNRCAYCRIPLKNAAREVDHIEPIAKGGSNRRTNLQILCMPCNRSKAAKSPIEFVRQRGLLL